MSLEQLIGYVLICLMIGIVYLATRVVSAVKYDNAGIYYLSVNAWLRGHIEYRQWLKDNTVYYWLILLIFSLIVMILCLIPPFSRGQMFNRPEIGLIISVPLWLAIQRTYVWLFKKLKMIE